MRPNKKPQASQQAALPPNNITIMTEKDRLYREKFMSFAIRCVKLKNYLNSEKHEFSIAEQLMRSGTSIGANQREASYAESDDDFVHKLAIAQKECNETMYWLELLSRTNYIDEEQYRSMFSDASELMRVLTSAIKTAKNKNKK